MPFVRRKVAAAIALVSCAASACGFAGPARASSATAARAVPQAELRSAGTYRAFRVGPVVDAAGGYGYGAWLATTRTNGPQRLELLDPANRRRTVKLRHPRDNAVAIVHGADPGGTPTVVAVVSWCKDEAFVEGCERAAYDVRTGRLVRTAWLDAVDRALPPTRERPTTVPATEDGLLVDVRTEEPAVTQEGYANNTFTCSSTVGTVGVQQRTVLPSISDCEFGGDLQLRDGLATFRALRPSDTYEYHGTSDLYAIDLRSAAPAWVRIGSWDQGRTGASGEPVSTIAGGRVITSTTQTVRRNFNGGSGWSLPALRAWDRAALAAGPTAVPEPIATLPENAAKGVLVGLGDDLLVTEEQHRRRKGSKRPLPYTVFHRVSLRR